MSRFECKDFHGMKKLAKCGEGAYGEVWYVEDVSGQKCALKIIDKNKFGADWKEELKGVSNYRKITESCPELLKIFSVQEDTDLFYYTMEPADNANNALGVYVPDTLAHRIGFLPEEEWENVIQRIFNGIKAIHKAGFAHRDIKPENILFVNGVPKIADIGLVYSKNSTSAQCVGTKEYIPPEVLKDDSSLSNLSSRQACDLYAFGKVIYCIVTGESVEKWPSKPSLFSLKNYRSKLFSHLSDMLCNDKADRLSDINVLERELAEIHLKLLQGETFFDKCKYFLSNFGRGILRCVRDFPQLFKRFWFFVFLIFFIATTGCWLLYRWYEKNYKFDLSVATAKTYRNDGVGMTMQIPAQWEVISQATLDKLIANMDENDESRRKFIMLVRELMRHGCDYIVCDFAPDFTDNISVQILPFSGDELLAMSADEVRMRVKNLFCGEFKFNTEIYETKLKMVNGYPCYFVDLSHAPGKIRINNYVFSCGKRCVAVALTSRYSAFQKNYSKFNAVLKTLKFDK